MIKLCNNESMEAVQKRGPGLAFLLAQVGGHAAARFGERLAALQLTPADAGIMRMLAGNAGLSQQELSARLGIHPSRLVAILDALENAGILQRKPNAEDRRQYALHLTAKGREVFSRVGGIAREHQEELCAGLSESERETLAELLRRIANQQGLTPGVHPGYRRMQPKR